MDNRSWKKRPSNRSIPGLEEETRRACRSPNIDAPRSRKRLAAVRSCYAEKRGEKSVYGNREALRRAGHRLAAGLVSAAGVPGHREYRECGGNFALFFCPLAGGISWRGRLLSSLWGHPGGKVLLSAASLALGAFLVFGAVMSCLMAAAIHRPPKENGTVVILGCQVKGTQPSLMLTKRLEAAKEYLDRIRRRCAYHLGEKATGNWSARPRP